MKRATTYSLVITLSLVSALANAGPPGSKVDTEGVLQPVFPKQDAFAFRFICSNEPNAQDPQWVSTHWKDERISKKADFETVHFNYGPTQYSWELNCNSVCLVLSPLDNQLFYDMDVTDAALTVERIALDNDNSVTPTLHYSKYLGNPDIATINHDDFNGLAREGSGVGYTNTDVATLCWDAKWISGSSVVRYNHSSYPANRFAIQVRVDVTEFGTGAKHVFYAEPNFPGIDIIIP
jgi:hypothetical protein